MKYYALNGAKKYDNVQNEDKGWYRDWAAVIELNGKKYVGYHSETYYWEGSGWEDDHHGPTYWSDLPKDFYEKYYQVNEEECSGACEALWYRFKDNNEEKATNSKMEFLKSLETENAHSSITKEMINNMKKKYDNTPVYNVKKVMEWLLEGKEVVYHLIGGESEEWIRLDPEKPVLDGDLYQYQLVENTKSKWNFKIPEYSLEASSREDALQKAYNLIVKNPSYIVVYPEEKDV